MLILADVEVGSYVNAWKVLPVVLVLFVWAKLLSWVDKDSPRAHLPREALNMGLLGTLIVAFFLFIFVPNFLLSFGVFFFLFVASVGAYLMVRSQKVGLADLKDEMKNMFKRKGKEADVKVDEDAVLLFNGKGNPMEPPAVEAPERGAYDGLQLLMRRPMRHLAEVVTVTPAERFASVRYVVDGFVYGGGELERTQIASTISYLKNVAGLDIEEKRKPQTGKFKAAMYGKKTEYEITTSGTAVGESMRLFAEPKNRFSLEMGKLGFSPEQLELMKQTVSSQGGVVLLAMPRGQGLTTLGYVVLRAHDVFLNHIHTVERNPEADLEGITQNKIAPNATGADESKQTDWVISLEPDILLYSKVEDARTATTLIAFAAERRVYIELNAGSTFDALSAWRKLVGDDSLAMKNLRLVVAGTQIRKLCSACKAGYTPDPVTLRKLNMDPDKVGKLFQARTMPMKDDKGRDVTCPFCHELYYRGRTGIFETMTVDDDVRNVVLSGGTSVQLKAVFRKQRARYLQEQALQLVEEGETSVQEVLRVLKLGGEAPPVAAPPKRPAPPVTPGKPTAPGKPMAVTKPASPRAPSAVKPAPPRRPAS